MSNLSVSWQRSARALVVAVGVVGAATGRAEDVEKPWDRSIAFGLAVTTGNSDSLQFNAGIRGEKIWAADELRLALDGTYGKSDGTVATEILRGLAQYKHLFTERFYGMVLADGLHDGVASIEYRFAVGPGLGYFFIKSIRTRLSFEAGPSYILEKTDVTHPNQPPVIPGPPPESSAVTSEARGYVAARIGERFEHKLNDSAKVWQQTEWLAQVDDFNNYLVNSEAGVEAALTKTMSLRLVGTHRYDNHTPDKRRHYDAALISSLTYKF